MSMAAIPENSGVVPDLRGYLWKKSPNPYRAKAFEKRYFILSGSIIAWWNTMEGALQKTEERKGFIDLVGTNVVIEPDLGNDTTFTLKPKDGVWKDGAIKKGDSGKSFTLDTTGTEHTRAAWLDAIDAHSGRAAQLAKTEDVVIPDTDFYEMLGLEVPAGSFQKIGNVSFGSACATPAPDAGSVSPSKARESSKAGASVPPSWSTRF